MSELVSRYGLPSGYICKIPIISEHIFTLSPTVISVCKESFWAGFYVPIHTFIEEFLDRYGSVPGQIDPNNCQAIHNFMI